MLKASTIAPAPAGLGFSGEILTEGDAGYGEANSRSGGGHLGLRFNQNIPPGD